ncbi:PIN domain-containing protein [Sphingobium sp.]|uniref:type II toxin-antitoxin system VapC family toxin n=1 Tax=Sphingobium sp. TaxID=1912891 RepID=UPI002627F97B|nr:PIN domain-containing protein [Sphingobium sp.]
MILADTSVWVDHLRAENAVLTALLEAGEVLCHPFVIGEIAMGSLHRREALLDTFNRLPSVTTASHAEVMHFIEVERLFGLGVGYLDTHLLASTKLTPDARFWTRDRRLHDAAVRLGIAWKSH